MSISPKIKSTFITLDKHQADAFHDERLSMLFVPLKKQPPEGYDRGAWYHAPIFGFTSGECPASNWWKIKCPFGQTGDGLVFGSEWATLSSYDRLKPRNIGFGAPISCAFFCDGGSDANLRWYGKPRPSIQMPQFIRDRMPRRAIKSIEVRRVNDICFSEVVKLGFGTYDHADMPEMQYWFDKKYQSHGASWTANSWCWLVEWW